MKRGGFTIIEILLAFGIIAVVGALSVPSYRYYSVVNDLERSVDQVKHTLRRAKLLSELNENDSGWGYHVSSGSLYKGTTYAGRDTDFDELQPLPASVTPSGLSEVSFAALTGEPSATGAIILTAVNGAQRIITIDGSAGHTIGEEEDNRDRLTICHRSGGGWHTIQIPEAAWPSHRSNHGDTLGPCSPDDE